MATERTFSTQKIDNSLMRILEKIMEQETNRNGEGVSYRKATAILAKRINDAGGIKE